jgi:hypothetical protein
MVERVAEKRRPLAGTRSCLKEGFLQERYCARWRAFSARTRRPVSLRPPQSRDSRRDGASRSRTVDTAVIRDGESGNPRNRVRPSDVPLILRTATARDPHPIRFRLHHKTSFAGVGSPDPHRGPLRARVSRIADRCLSAELVSLTPRHSGASLSVTSRVLKTISPQAACRPRALGLPRQRRCGK